MAAAEVINHAPLDLPQLKDVVRSPSFHLPIPPQPAKHDKKRSRKKKENPTLESHLGYRENSPMQISTN